MSDDSQPKRSVSDELLPKFTVGNAIVHPSQNKHQEIFRNNTTAVEVIVKQTGNKKSRPIASNTIFDNDKIKRFADDIENLKMQLGEANKNLDDTKMKFKIVMYEMQKQLEAAYQRELKRQTKALAMQLEKEKFRTLLECKSKLIKKLTKELLSMRRILKIVIKGIRSTPALPTTLLSKSDIEYAEFEEYLGKDAFCMSNILDSDGLTFESILSSKM